MVVKNNTFLVTESKQTTNVSLDRTQLSLQVGHDQIENLEKLLEAGIEALSSGSLPDHFAANYGRDLLRRIRREQY